MLQRGTFYDFDFVNNILHKSSINKYNVFLVKCL